MSKKFTLTLFFLASLLISCNQSQPKQQAEESSLEFLEFEAEMEAKNKEKWRIVDSIRVVEEMQKEAKRKAMFPNAKTDTINIRGLKIFFEKIDIKTTT